MIKVYFSPQVSEYRIEYSFEGERMIVKIGDKEDVFDFTPLPDGGLDFGGIDLETGIDTIKTIETVLPVNPVISAKRVDGILHLELLNWISTDAPHESRFPEWVELPLPKDKIIQSKEPAHKAIIPWRTKQEMESERIAKLLAEQESQVRRSKIKTGLTTACTIEELRLLLKDMATELGL